MVPFRERYTIQERINDRVRVMAKRPGYCAAILLRGDPKIPPLGREKFLLPGDLKGAQLQYVIRKKLALKATEALFLVCDGHAIVSTDDMSTLYAKHHAKDDGFLYIVYTLENAFG